MELKYDRGPTKRLLRHFAKLPDHSPFRELFWYDWGPIFYRGRLNGSARLLCVASDPGPTERIAGRSLVGDAGQRVQGFLAKLGLTRSYVCLNAFVYALHPSKSYKAQPLLREPQHVKWRNRLFQMVLGPDLQAIVAFGRNAQVAIDEWQPGPNVPVFNVYHPSYRNQARLLDSWHSAIAALRAAVTPDPDGDQTAPNYASRFRESDYAAIPKYDLPFGFPELFGDDAWGRAARPRHNNAVRRPSPDDAHTLRWIAPDTR
jgi:uracil-DNA glycosylase